MTFYAWKPEQPFPWTAGTWLLEVDLYGWVIEHATIQDNSGAGLMAGARQKVRASCLRDNGQYGMNAYKGGGAISDLVVEDNEIVGNNTDDWETRRKGCGCARHGR